MEYSAGGDVPTGFVFSLVTYCIRVLHKQLPLKKSSIAFDHALNGPFDNPLFLPGSQLPGALCMARNCLYFRLIGLIIVIILRRN